jgi:prepilin-type N-terminal cleavage/methylation domain-containing protein
MITKHYSRAFTLVEMLVVIAIIALLTGIIMTNLSGSKAKSRDAQMISDIGQIQLALGLYFDRCNQYPTTIQNPPAASNGCPKDSNGNQITIGSYIGKIPVPPGGSPTSYDYAVNNTTAPTDYVLHAKLEKSNDSITKNGLTSSSPGSFTIVFPTSGTFSCSDASDSLEYCVGSK